MTDNWGRGTGGFGQWFNCLVALLLYCSFPVAHAQITGNCEPWLAKLVSLEGRAEVLTHGQSQWKAVQPGQHFCAGDTLRVLQNPAALRLSNQTVLRVKERSTLKFVEPRQGFWLELLGGFVHFITRTPKRFEITTPYHNAVVEGTEFFVAAGDGQGEVGVFEGQVQVANDQGQLSLTGNQRAIARAGTPPRKVTAINLRDAVAWALYYPPVLTPSDTPEDISRELTHGQASRALERLAAVPEAEKNSDLHALEAGLSLYLGQVERASILLAKTFAADPDNVTALSLQSITTLASGDPQKALQQALANTDRWPGEATAWLALSYAQQGVFDLPKALQSARQALALRPNAGLLHARLAELALANGESRKAMLHAQQAQALAPGYSRTYSVLGFAALNRFALADAEAAFQQAATLDPSDPMPRLGLGLAAIRRGDLAQGRELIELAAILDPGNSLIRSYLGKAYFEQKKVSLAATELAIAKQLDPNDPTPWFYGAIHEQTRNRPVEALAALEKSIALNDNRAVYRSRLLLDADRATRGTSLARIHDDLGFEQLALVTAAKSLSYDPGNHSAHRFLSDAYAGRSRHEIARVSELLQAQLLQPLNVNPIQPRLTVTDLNIVAGAGPAEAAFNEYTPLFERNRPQLVVSALGGDNDTWGEEVVVSGLADRLSYSLGQFHYETDGFRQNNDLEHDIYNVFAQYDVTPGFNVQAEVRSRETRHGDLSLDFDPGIATDDRRRLKHDSARLGGHIAVSPRQDLVASLIYSDRRETLRDFQPQVIADRVIEDQGYQVEAQYLHRASQANFIAGLGSYSIEVETQSTLDFTPSPFGVPCPPVIPVSICNPSLPDFDRERHNVYVYTDFSYPGNLIWTLGLSYDTSEHFIDFESEDWNPKLGLQWEINPDLRLRLATFRTVKPALVVDQTLEPTQVAGFNQFFDDFNGSRVTRKAAGLDARLSANLDVGVEASRRDLEIPFSNQQTNRFSRKEDREEMVYRGYAYWTPGSDWAVSAEYQLEKFDRNSDPALLLDELPVKIETQVAPLGLHYFNRQGFFAELTATYVHQDVERRATAARAAGHSDFYLIDAAIGYRLPLRKGVVALESKNLADRNFRFWDANFFASEPKNPRFIPDRAILVRLTLNF